MVSSLFQTTTDLDTTTLTYLHGSRKCRSLLQVASKGLYCFLVVAAILIVAKKVVAL